MLNDFSRTTLSRCWSGSSSNLSALWRSRGLAAPLSVPSVEQFVRAESHAKLKEQTVKSTGWKFTCLRFGNLILIVMKKFFENKNRGLGSINLPLTKKYKEEQRQFTILYQRLIFGY
jgi:hypothetical protein